MNRRQALEAIARICTIPAAIIIETEETCWLSMRYHLSFSSIKHAEPPAEPDGSATMTSDSWVSAVITFSFKEEDVQERDPGFSQELQCSFDNALTYLVPKLVRDGWCFRLTREKPDLAELWGIEVDEDTELRIEEVRA